MSRFSLVLLLVVSGSALAVDKAAPINDDVDSIIQRQLLPAYRDGNTLLLWREISGLLPMSDEKIMQLDGQLKKHGLPRTAKLLAELRSMPDLQLPRASRHEVLLLLRDANQRITEQIEARDQLFILHARDETSFEKLGAMKFRSSKRRW